MEASAVRPTTADVYSIFDMKALVDTIDTEPDPIPMRWLNAMLGRVFFGLYRTEALEQVRFPSCRGMGLSRYQGGVADENQFIISKIMKKLSKVPRPSFLSPIIVREVNVGTFPPMCV